MAEKRKVKKLNMDSYTSDDPESDASNDSGEKKQSIVGGAKAKSGSAR